MQWAHPSRQPGLGLVGMTLVMPVTVMLGVGFDGAERSLLVLGPISTSSLPVIALVAFWWNGWPGTTGRPPLTGLLNTLLVSVGGVVFTVAAQTIVAHADLRGVFDPSAGASHAPTFPATMPLAAAIFVAMLELTLVCEGWPLRRANPIADGVAALAVAWGVGVVLYKTLVGGAAAVPPGQFGAALICVAVLQVAFYVVLQSWPFSRIRSRALRLGGANVVVIAGGVGIYMVLYGLAGVRPATISAVGGAAVAAGLVLGVQFEGWLDSLFLPGHARLVDLTVVAIGTAVIYLGLTAYAHATDWTRAAPEEWVSYAGLNAIGVGVLLHVAVGHRWPFALPERPEF